MLSHLLLLAGSILVTGPLIIYQIASEASARTAFDAYGLLAYLTYPTLSLLVVGLSLVFLGLSLTIAYGNLADHSIGSNSLRNMLSSIMKTSSSFRVFPTASIAYGLFFAFVSSTLVYRPGADFAASYGVLVPSAVPVVCCGSAGQMPQLVIYLTRQFGMILVPLNLILLFMLSWLVGLNVTIARYAIGNFRLSLKHGWVGGIGAVAGLFTLCPSCAGLFLLSAVGLGGAVGFATQFSVQLASIAIGIPLLLISPLLGVKRLQSCSFS